MWFLTNVNYSPNLQLAKPTLPKLEQQKNATPNEVILDYLLLNLLNPKANLSYRWINPQHLLTT